MVFQRKSIIFFLGMISGIIFCCLVFVVIGVVGAIFDWDQMTSGICGDLYVDINEAPGKNYDWSLDILKQGKTWAQFGKRLDSDSVDRCKIYGPYGDIMIYMVLADNEALPGVAFFKDGISVANLTFDENLLMYWFTYGPYGLPEGKINQGDLGFRDIDFDGQFDIKDVFNADGTLSESFIWHDAMWKKVKALEETRAVLEADSRLYIFNHEEAWHLEVNQDK